MKGSQPHEEDRRMRHELRSARLLLALLPAACVAIGPSVNVAPGPGKSPGAFASDRRSCMADIDRRLQPVADQINTLGISASTNASNNQRLQRDYDRGFSDCMAARGNVPDTALMQPVAFAASATPPAPVLSKAVEGVLTDGWQLMQHSYHGGPREAKDANDGLWSREIEDPSIAHGHSLSVSSMSFRDGDKTVLLSIAGQGEPACDNGPNDVNSTRDYALCPAKLAVVQAGRVISTRSVGRACAEAINEGGVRPGAPDWKDPRKWGTRGRYDAASGTIELVTMQHGRPEPACAKQLPVR